MSRDDIARLVFFGLIAGPVLVVGFTAAMADYAITIIQGWRER